MNIIVAASKNMGIGFENQLPWFLKKELQYFKNKTIGTDKNNIILTGKNTWDSLPIKPLPNRINCIMSRGQWDHKNAYFFSDKDSFLNFAKIKPYDKIWIIGGESIYKQFINEPYVKNIYLTHLLHDFECDTFFPEILPEYKLIQQSAITTENNIHYKHKLFSKV
jgi:dihydrofolate reductase|tara:strand:+ start:733 stop:1227 length:495 start_codon:yes stop_codon:yes gene_type:complete